MNVCGIISKLRCHEFVSFINNYDIVWLQETKTDDTGKICIPGFVVYMYNRMKLTQTIDQVVLHCWSKISPYVKVDSKTECNLANFFTISKDLYGSNDSLYDED